MDHQDQQDPITESGVQLLNEDLIISVLKSFDSSELPHHAMELMGVIPWGFIPPQHPEISLVADRVETKHLLKRLYENIQHSWRISQKLF